MASSIARMPPDEWCVPSAAGVMGACTRSPKPLRKVLTRVSSCNASIGEPCSPATAARRRQSQILDRWAARQAREMVTTIERQAHEAELSELSARTEPVSARAASFLRENSTRNFSDSPVADLPPNVRASSLIQMWRELEAEAKPRTPSTVIPPKKEISNFSDATEEAEMMGFGDWESTEPTASSSSASSSSTAESDTERRKVVEIAKTLSLKISPSAPSSGDEGTPALSPPTAKSPSSTMGKKSLRFRTRREMAYFLTKMEEERRREVALLAERHPVSRFPFRGRIQSLIRLRSLRREVATIRHQQWSRKLEAESLKNASSNLFLREISEGRSQHNATEALTEERTSAEQFDSLESQDSEFSIVYNSDAELAQNPELVSASDLLGCPQAFLSPQVFFTPLSRQEDLQESPSPDASWGDRSAWGYAADSKPAADSPNMKEWHAEIAAKSIEVSTKEQQVTSMYNSWLPEQSNSARGWGFIRRTFYHDSLSHFADNEDIRELLERKTVSNSLASDFCDKLNQIILSFLHKQAQYYVYENKRVEYQGQAVWRQRNEDSYSQDASSSLVSSQFWHHLNRWQSTSFIQNPSERSESMHDGIAMPDLRSSILLIHQELSELRKLVESCVKWQTKLERSIKEEFSSAVKQLGEIGKCSPGTKWMPGKRDACYICSEAQVDAVLYRCGHMCACFNCAQGLQWSSGRCPICCSMIIDVVRAYPNS